MKIIVNGKSDKHCFKCDGKENVRNVAIPAEPFNGNMCIPCISKKTDAPVEKVQRKKNATNPRKAD